MGMCLENTLISTKDEEFHKSRIAFAEITNTKLALAYNDPRSHRKWLQEDFSINDEKFEKIIRGYIKDGRIVIYKGSEFKEASSEEIFDLLHKLSSAEPDIVRTHEVYTGLKVGEPGEIWEPIRKVNIRYL